VTQLLNPIKNLIGWLLNAFFTLPPHNLGLAITLMTALVMLVMLPLTAKQVRSMVAMQKLQPEIKRIQQENKDDKQAQSQAIMAFYKENQINPLSGCLPLLVQFPVWIALYDTLKTLPSHLPKAGKLYQKLCATPLPNTHKSCGTTNLHPQKFLGMNLQLSLFDAHKNGTTFLHLLPYGLLVGFVVATGIYQTRQTMARQKRQNPDQPINPQMQSMMRIMPIMNLITILFPTGVAVYWGVRNIWMIGQQQLVLNKIYETHSGPVNVKSNDVTLKDTKALGIAPAAAGSASEGSGNGNGSNGNGQNRPRNGAGNGAAKSGAAKGATAAARAKSNPNTSKKKQQRRKR
jgi:YidC/Oxa1 family membrane protein insertase